MGFSLRSLLSTMKGNKAYVALLFIQFVYAGRYVFAKLAISKGMNPYVFVFYRQAFASLALAPFAFFLEREKPPQLSLNLLCKIFFVSLGRITLSLNLDSYSMNYISATFAAAIGNTVPAITFIMALCLRMESISVKHWHGSAKVIGSAASLLGAMVFIFIKGPSMFGSSHSETSAPTADYSSKSDWLKGSLAATASNVAWSIWIIVQGPIVKQYPAKLRLTALQTFFSCIQSAIWAASVERNLSTWKLGWDINFLSVAYCGIIFTGITYWLRSWVIESRAIITPLTFLIMAILSAISWKETPHWGSFTNIHPFAPTEQAEGYQEMFNNLSDMLYTITGFDSFSLQPNAGATGEYAGLMVIRAYHKARGDHQELRKAAEGNKDTLSALMVTYPSTHGVYEDGIDEICKIIHDNGCLHGWCQHECTSLIISHHRFYTFSINYHSIFFVSLVVMDSVFSVGN